MPDYTFTPVRRADYPVLMQWLNAPHINGWWGPASDEINLIDAEIDNDLTDMYMIATAGQPFAFIQDYDVHLHHVPHYQTYPPQSRAIDTFIGRADFLGKGHCQRYLVKHCNRLFDRQVPCIVVDPELANVRAISAYKKAGFRLDQKCVSDTGKCLQIMYLRAHQH